MKNPFRLLVNRWYAKRADYALDHKEEVDVVMPRGELDRWRECYAKIADLDGRIDRLNEQNVKYRIALANIASGGSTSRAEGEDAHRCGYCGIKVRRHFHPIDHGTSCPKLVAARALGCGDGRELWSYDVRKTSELDNDAPANKLT